MNALFLDALDQLKAAGIAFEIPADLDTLNHLRRLSDQAEGHGFADATHALYRPTVRVGNVTLHRLTIGTEAFLTERVAAWYADDGNSRRTDLATAYVMAHTPTAARDIVPFWDDPEGFGDRVSAWKRGVAASWGELVAGIELFIAQERISRMEVEIADSADRKAPAAYGPLIEMLCRDYGQTPGHWLWTASLAEINTILGARSARAVREAKAIGPVKGEAPDPNRPDLAALRDFLRAVAAIKARKAVAA